MTTKEMDKVLWFINKCQAMCKSLHILETGVRINEADRDALNTQMVPAMMGYGAEICDMGKVFSHWLTAKPGQLSLKTMK